TYIVDYIVQNTLGELLKDKKVDASKIRVLDPACGSGSFLIKAFDVLNEYYKNKDKNYEQTKLGKDALPYSKKLEILQNNIFGVDLDKQAVEIAQLNLLLKVAEKGKRLPLLKKNIKCGNSLIDDHNVAGDKAFKWEEEFKEIMDEGGFDVVIGNPPYFTMQSTGIKIQSYFSSSSRWKDVYRGQSDILYYFIIQGLRLLKNGGFLGFITSRYWLENKWSDKLREFILNNTKITKIIDFRDFYIFSDANIHTCIIIIQKENNNLKRINNQIKYKNLKNKINDIYKFLHSNESNSIKQGELKAENIWVFDENKNIIKKIEQNSIKLGELCFVSKGMDTGFNKAFIIDEKIIQNENIEKQILKRVLKNSDISRYFIKDSKLYLIYTTNDVKIENFKNTKKWLEKFKKELTNRWEYRRGGCTWFRISTLRSKNLFDSAKEKIYTPYRSSKNNFALDDKNFYGMTDTTIIVNKKESTSLKYLLGILNSKLMNFYVIVTGKKKGTSYEYFADYLKQIPIKLCSEKDEKLVIENVKKIITLFNKLNEIGDKKTDERAKIEEEIKKTDAEIDELVYKIYGITEEEKKIIEESLEGN
ncbi:MAG: N-6 DNA methylase, partial [Candidatus Aenigmarchaeota archaeon]|nr:N-6 DNA methylase [Candidatus Aenigmarchaeota archaeon]